MEWLKIVEMIGRLGIEVGRWIADLIAAGEEDPESVVRVAIADRRAEIAERRIANDSRLRAKHGMEP